MSEAPAPRGGAEASDVAAAEAAEPAVSRVTRTTDVVVIGGGAAGLVAALECARIGLSVTVLERGEHPGGCIGRIELAGLTLDSGAESFATRGGSVAELLDSLGLDGDDLVTPNVAGAWLAMPDGKGGVKSAPLPKTGVLGIPANPLGEDVRAIIGWSGALRAYTDRLKPILRIGRARSLGQLVRSRMGKQVLDRLVTPISSGVYSADPMDLDVDVVAPGLNEAMTRQGSLSGGVGELVESRKAGSAVLGVRGGMHRVVDALLAELGRFEASVVTSAEATSLTALGDLDDEVAPGAPRWRVAAKIVEPEASGGLPELVAGAPASTSSASSQASNAAIELVVDARFAIVAAPARASRPLLGEAVHGWVDAGDWPDPASVEIVTLVLDAPALDGAPRGTGLLVAADTTGVGAKAFTHSSAKWAWLAEAAAPRHVVRLSYGRAGAANPLDGLGDDAVAELALADLSKLTGLRLDRRNLVELGRTAWRDALSHAALGQQERVEQLEETLAAVPGLEATGAWLSGTGLASVVPHARAAAARIRHLAVSERAGD